jgi:hypothetical protein
MQSQNPENMVDKTGNSFLNLIILYEFITGNLQLFLWIFRIFIQICKFCFDFKFNKGFLDI